MSVKIRNSRFASVQVQSGAQNRCAAAMGIAQFARDWLPTPPCCPNTPRPPYRPAPPTWGWSVRVCRFSSTTLRTPYFASSSAVVSPVGPPPAMTTGTSSGAACAAAEVLPGAAAMAAASAEECSRRQRGRAAARKAVGLLLLAPASAPEASALHSGAMLRAASAAALRLMLRMQRCTYPAADLARAAAA